MNRAQRRQWAKENKTPFKDVAKDPGVPDRTKAVFCWRHPIFVADPKNPTEKEKEKIEAIRLKSFKRLDEKTGKMTMGRSCRKCGNTIFIDYDKEMTTPSLQGYTTEPKEDTMKLWH